MAEFCEACNKNTDFLQVVRLKEEGNDCNILQCAECRSFLTKGSMTEKAMRDLTARIDVPWHMDPEGEQFICEYNGLHLVFPTHRPWSCDKCFRGCAYEPRLSKANLTFTWRAP